MKNRAIGNLVRILRYTRGHKTRMRGIDRMHRKYSFSELLTLIETPILTAGA